MAGRAKDANFSVRFVDTIASMFHHPTEDANILVGEVDDESALSDLQWEMLRRKAIKLTGGLLKTKIVFPESVIYYGTCHAPGPSPDERIAQIRQSLVEGTGAEAQVSDFAFDWFGDGDTVQIAVVETDVIRQAVDYATPKGLNPVAFSAEPSIGQFGGEPLFDENFNIIDNDSPDENLPSASRRLLVGRGRKKWSLSSSIRRLKGRRDRNAAEFRMACNADRCASRAHSRIRPAVRKWLDDTLFCFRSRPPALFNQKPAATVRMAAIAAFAVAFQFIASHPLSAADEIVEYAPVLRPPIIGPPVVLRPDYLTEPTAIASADQLPEQAIPLDSAEATPEDQKLVQVSDEAVQIDPPDATSVGAEGAAPGLGIHRYPYATTDGPELQDSGATGGSRVAPPPKRPESIAARTAESLPPPRPDYISNTRRRVVRSAAFGELQMGPPPRPANLAAYAAVAAAHSSSKQKDQKAYETVASHATQNGALKNARLVLIGIVGKPGQAKALVRLRGGSLVSLSVGDKLNGGRIKSIQRDHLIYTRGDSTRRLAMPD